MEQLTVKEAIEQGYTHYGFGNREWQHTQDLHDDIFDEVNPEDWEDLVLFDKEIRSSTIDPKQIAELLSDYIGENDEQECAREDDVVYQTILDMDFSETATKINKELKRHSYYMLTDIKLIK